jgi:hypothetical protein
MTRPVYFGLMALSLFVSTGQDAFSPARTYVAGEKDVYGLSMKMATGSNDVTITGKLSYEVKKVYENGDADLESKTYDVVISAMGTVMNQPNANPRLVRYNKFGAAIEQGVPKDQRQPIFMRFLTYRSEGAMKVGEAVQVDETLDDEQKTRVKGSAKLESLADGVAKVVSNVEITNVKSKKPTKISSIGYFDVKTSKLNRAESRLQDVEPGAMPGLPALQSITVVIEREHSKAG